MTVIPIHGQIQCMSESGAARPRQLETKQRTSTYRDGHAEAGSVAGSNRHIARMYTHAR